MYSFRTKKKDKEKRERWKQLVGRKAGSKLWSLSKDSRICSDHFQDSEPTVGNPLPTLKLGYADYEKRVQRISFFGGGAENKSNHKKVAIAHYISISDETTQIKHEDPPVECIKPGKSIFEYLWPWVVWVLNLLLHLKNNNNEIRSLKKENARLRETIKGIREEKIRSSLKTDEDFNFYTGLKSRSVFEHLHSIISPLVKRRWTGVSSLTYGIRKFKKKAQRFGPERKLSSRCEFLLTLMKLRLGLLNKDLAKRFDISTSLCSRIFFCVVKNMQQSLTTIGVHS